MSGGIWVSSWSWSLGLEERLFWRLLFNVEIELHWSGIIIESLHEIITGIRTGKTLELIRAGGVHPRPANRPACIVAIIPTVGLTLRHVAD